jgi:hypothetical protein
MADDAEDAEDAEDELLEKHGMTINFQLYRADHTKPTRAAMQGERLAELTIEGAEVTGLETVADVKERILPRLLGNRTAPHLTFVISGREMEDTRLFYADHFILLPCWVQVVLSDVPFADVIARMRQLPE